MARCPFNCTKFREANETANILFDKNKALNAENEALQKKAHILDSLQVLSEKGYHIIGIEKNCVITMWPISTDTWECYRHFYLFKLPFEAHCDFICNLVLKYKSNCRAYIVDWHSRMPDQGYGSLLMKHLIKFLRISGVRYITGSIAPTDMKNEAKLRHFYTKFGFKITDCQDSCFLRLDLFNEEIRPLDFEGYEVCCRSSSYQRLRSEQLLQEDL